MTDLLVIPLLVIGTIFVLLAGVGVFRMPDLFSRMQASTKAGTLGVGCLLVAVGLHFGDLGVATRALLVVAFLFLTAPVAAHMIAQAAYFTDVPRWEGTVIDEFRDMHDCPAGADAPVPPATNPSTGSDGPPGN